MTYAQALMIIRNPDCYSRIVVHRAVVTVLGTLNAKPEDLALAASLA